MELKWKKLSTFQHYEKGGKDAVIQVEQLGNMSIFRSKLSAQFSWGNGYIGAICTDINETIQDAKKWFNKAILG